MRNGWRDAAWFGFARLHAVGIDCLAQARNRAAARRRSGYGQRRNRHESENIHRRAADRAPFHRLHSRRRAAWPPV
ncbi:hypothetical protein C3E97_032935, partial [Pseudomonas sp. MWU12-2115]